MKNDWISVKDRLPGNEEKVLICAERKCEDTGIKQIITTAMYEDGKMYASESKFLWNEDDFEYDEEKDDYIISEGWWEQNIYSDTFYAVDDFVTHWMPLPEPYKSKR